MTHYYRLKIDGDPKDRLKDKLARHGYTYLRFRKPSLPRQVVYLSSEAPVAVELDFGEGARLEEVTREEFEMLRKETFIASLLPFADLAKGYPGTTGIEILFDKWADRTEDKRLRRLNKPHEIEPIKNINSLFDKREPPLDPYYRKRKIE
ncbi:MAG: hypothetical protein AABW87_00460 [Nanoarchaeota archaeon]